MGNEIFIFSGYWVLALGTSPGTGCGGPGTGYWVVALVTSSWHWVLTAVTAAMATATFQ